MPNSAAEPVAEPLKSEARLPVEGKNVVAEALAEKSAVSEPVPYKAASPVALAEKSALRDPLAGRNVEALPLRVAEPVNAPKAGS